MTTAVCMSNVSVEFTKKNILKNVHLTVPSSGLSVIAGRSGSGKTTLLRTINRLNEEFSGCKTSGTIQVDIGQGLEVISPKLPSGYTDSYIRQRIGMVFQVPNVFPVSIQQNMLIPLKNAAGYSHKEALERMWFALERVGLMADVRSRMDDHAVRLSVGQQQRLCLARVLALDPAILLLDEPTASLDVHAAREIESLIGSFAEQYPVIMVSHNISQVCRLASQVTILVEGRVRDSLDTKSGLSEKALISILECC